MTDDRYICCIAANAAEAEAVAQRVGKRIKYIDRAERLYGTDGFRRSVYVTQAAQLRPDIDRVTTEALLRGYNLIHI